MWRWGLLKVEETLQQLLAAGLDKCLASASAESAASLGAFWNGFDPKVQGPSCPRRVQPRHSPRDACQLHVPEDSFSHGPWAAERISGSDMVWAWKPQKSRFVVFVDFVWHPCWMIHTKDGPYVEHVPHLWTNACKLSLIVTWCQVKIETSFFHGLTMVCPVSFGGDILWTTRLPKVVNPAANKKWKHIHPVTNMKTMHLMHNLFYPFETNYRLKYVLLSKIIYYHVLSQL